MIIRPRIVVTMHGPPIENGAVAVEGSSIVDVGRFREVKARNSGEVIDLEGQVLLPGLINAHCHLDYTCLRGKLARPQSFTDWIRTINAAKSELTPVDYLHSIAEGFAEARRFGTTSIANLTGFPNLISQAQPSIRTWWFAELIDVRDPGSAKAIVDSAVTSLEAVQNRGLAPHAPYTASGGLYRYAEQLARHNNFLLTTHLAESVEESKMFSEQRGPLWDFLSSIGRDMSDLNGATPIEHFLDLCTTDRRWLLVHLNDVRAQDLELLATSSDKPHVIHCPRSHQYFGHPPFQLQRIRELGFNICIGTDSLASNRDLSLLAELRALRKKEPALSSSQLIEMITVNPARALGWQQRVGLITPGLLADLVSIPVREGDDSLSDIIGYEGAVLWMMIDGKVADFA